tara:strand:- start:139 stop:327 length:189 start_codon:yes stop_codon:yes gene_type:complete
MENLKLFKESLELLKTFDKEQLLDETEQLLLCLLEREPTQGKALKTLTSLNDFWKKGGLKQR